MKCTLRHNSYSDYFSSGTTISKVHFTAPGFEVNDFFSHFFIQQECSTWVRSDSAFT